MSDEFIVRFVNVFREVRRGFPLREIQASLRKQEGLTADQVEILTILFSAPFTSHRMGDLARDLRAHHTNVARTIRQLTVAGYVERTRCEDDARGVIVRLTAKGRTVAGRLRERRDVYLRAILEEFPGSEGDELIDFLERLGGVLARIAADFSEQP